MPKSNSLQQFWAAGGNSRFVAIGLPVLAGLLLPLQALMLARILSAAIVDGRPLAMLVGEVSLFAALLGLRVLLNWLGDRAAVVASETAKQRVRADLVGAVLGHGPIWTCGRPSGLLASLVVEQVESMDGYLGRYMPALAQAAILPLAFVVVIAPLDALVATLFALTTPLIPIFMALVGWGAEAASRAQAAALGRLNAYFGDRLRGIVTLKLLGREQAEVAGMRRSSEELRQRTMKVLRIAFLSSAVLEFFAALGVAGVALYVGLGLLGLLPLRVEPMSLELGLFFLLMAPEVYQPMRTLAAHHHDRAAAKAALEAMVSELGPPAAWAPAPTGAPSVVTVQSTGLELRDLSVAAPDGHAVIRGVSLTVRPGEHVALMGRSGSGKSTLLEAIVGLREHAGEVLLGSTPLMLLQSPDLRPPLLLLAQRPKLFAGTIADNIALGRAGADNAAIRRAAELAMVTAFADKLPQGLDTMLGENGVGLSGGEAQRVALARLYLAAPDVILLDEPTSHLDAATEAEVLARLFAFARGRTMLIATHSPAVAGLATRQLRLDGGRLNAARPARAGEFAP